MNRLKKILKVTLLIGVAFIVAPSVKGGPFGNRGKWIQITFCDEKCSYHFITSECDVGDTSHLGWLRCGGTFTVVQQ